jgi:chromosome segregation ATPase
MAGTSSSDLMPIANAIQDEVAELLQDVSEADAQFADYSQALEGTTASITEGLSALQSRLDNLSNVGQTLQEQMESLLSELESTVGDMTTGLDEAQDAAVAATRTAQESAAAFQGALESHQSTLEQAVNQVPTLLSQLEVEYRFSQDTFSQAFNAMVEQINQPQEALNEFADSLRQGVEGVSGSFEQLEGSARESFEELLTQCADRQEALLETLNATQTKIVDDQINATLDGLRNSVETAQAAIDGCIENINAAVETVNDNIAQLDGGLTEAKDDFDAEAKSCGDSLESLRDQASNALSFLPGI